MSTVILRRWLLNDHSLVYTGEETTHLLFRFIGHRALQDIRFLFRRWSLNGRRLEVTGHSVVTLAEEILYINFLVSQDTELSLSESVEFTSKMVSKCPSVSDTAGETVDVHCSGVPGERALQVSRIILGRCSCNGRPFGGDTGGD